MSDINEMNVGPRWYVAHTYAGYENKVKANLEKIIENRGMGHLIYDIRIPVETIVEKVSEPKKGRAAKKAAEPTGEDEAETKGEDEKVTEIKVFPSYVFVKMTMTEESWHAVRNITGVTGFVGPGSRPTPLSDAEVEALSIEEKRTEKLAYDVGDEVNIVSGLFEGYNGTVQAISEDNKKVTVLVKRGRRDMPVELEANMLKAVK